MKHLLVAKDVNYAASKTSATTETALSPETLANGAIGIYGIDDTAANDNAGRLTLITVNTTAAGKIADSAYKGKSLYLAVGTADGCFISNPVQVDNISSVRGKAYVAPVKQVSYIGYDSTTSSGSLSLDQFLDKDEGSIGIVVTNLTTQQFPNQTFSTGRIYANSTPIEILNGVAARAKANQNSVITVGIVSNGAQTDLDNTASVTNDSVVVNSTAHGLSVGDIINVSGETYSVALVPTVNQFHLDRPYHGATDAALAVTEIGELADVTEYGFKLTAKNIGDYFETSANGIFERATHSTPTPTQLGSGSGPQIVAMEKNRSAYLGYHDRLDTRVKAPVIQTDVSLNYDLYFIVANNEVKNRAMMGYKNNVELNIALAFPTGGSNSNQSSFEGIIPVLHADAVIIP